MDVRPFSYSRFQKFQSRVWTLNDDSPQFADSSLVCGFVVCGLAVSRVVQGKRGRETGRAKCRAQAYCSMWTPQTRKQRRKQSIQYLSLWTDRIWVAPWNNEYSIWAPRVCWEVALDCPNVKCNNPGKTTCNINLVSRAHPVKEMKEKHKHRETKNLTSAKTSVYEFGYNRFL